MSESNVKQAEKEMDARLDSVFEGVDAPNEVPSDTQRLILTQMRQMYLNTISQHKAEMRIALRLNDKAQQDAVREAVKKCLTAIDELDVMLNELPHTNGTLSI